MDTDKSNGKTLTTNALIKGQERFFFKTGNVFEYAVEYLKQVFTNDMEGKWTYSYSLTKTKNEFKKPIKHSPKDNAGKTLHITTVQISQKATRRECNFLEGAKTTPREQFSGVCWLIHRTWKCWHFSDC